MPATSGVVTFLFTDIEGSSRLWEQEPSRMREAVGRHDAIVREAVADHRGRVVKMLGDGVHAAFDDPLDAVNAAIALQRGLATAAADGLALAVRGGLHAGVEESRDDDYFGRAVNRAARIMAVAHGGQILVSAAVTALVGERLPAGVALRDLGEVRLRDLASPERVYQVVHPELRAEFPALRALTTTPNNLPQQLTSFVGRERESAEVAELLARSRLLTLQGGGGIGKTRLSLKVAAEVIGDYPDGVWLVELAAISDARLVPQAVASVLGVKEAAGREVVEALEKFVQDRRLLIVLDNCEHLVQACAEVAGRLLRAGPDVRVLTSSREPLHVRGEAIYPLAPLPVPDGYAEFKRTTLEGFAAARLFVERAVAAQPAFAVSDDNASAVAGICRRLDGIPLALELAAARVRALSVEQILGRLSDRFRLLTGGDRTALPRQQTLRALIDWSYDLLTAQERAVFRRLAVLAGGFTLDAAEAVGADGDLAGPDVLGTLSNLVEKSLVVMDFDAGRYRMLETVRQYAQERLAESGEADDARTRHLAFYLGLVERARPLLAGPEEQVWLARLDAEMENILAAHAWCDSARDGSEQGVRLAFAVKPYWYNRGLLVLGLRVTVEALARSGAQGRTRDRARALADAGQYCSFMGRYGEARQHLEESLSIARELDDRNLIARVLQPLGLALLGQRDLAAARQVHDEALLRARAQDDRRELAAALNARAQVCRVEGALDAAASMFRDVIALAREIGDREITAIGLLNLAMVSISQGNPGDAMTALREAAAIAADIGSRPAGQSAIEVSAGLAVAQGDWSRAARFFGMAEALVAATGMHRDPADDSFLLPRVAEARDRLGAAAFAEDETAGRAIAYEAALAEASAWLARGA